MGLRNSKVSAQRMDKRAWSFWGAGNRDKGKARSGRKHRGNANLVRAGQVVLGGQTCRLIPAISLNLFCLDSSRCAGTLPTLQGGGRVWKERSKDDLPGRCDGDQQASQKAACMR
jgi:hypothetical protein